jgi:hypothetical protein
MQIAFFQHQGCLARRKHRSIRLSLKLRLEARVHWGGCKPWNADFEAWADQFCWMRCFGVLRSHKICRILKRAGREAEVRQIRREKAEFLTKMHLKCIQHQAQYVPWYFSVQAIAVNSVQKVF